MRRNAVLSCIALPCIACIALGVVFCASTPLSAEPLLTFPVQCTLGETCFLQQMVDVDPGTGALDPVCGIASHNGHTGTDIRTAQLIDVGSYGTVIAAADGVVSGFRDGMPDRLTESSTDRAALGGRECGNGVVIDHANGLQTQYCHLAQGSVRVESGQQISAGDVLGSIGLSGSTQFPHLELTVRRDGEVVDPFTGRMSGEGCEGPSETLWEDARLAEAATQTTRIIGAGLAAGVFNHSTLVREDPLPLYDGAESVVAWTWALNVRAGDVFLVELTGPDGFTYRNTSEPVESNSAAFTDISGRRVDVVAGRYIGAVGVFRDGQQIDSARVVAVIE